MHKAKIYKRQLKNFWIYKDLYRKPLKRDRVARAVFLIQILLFFGGRCNRYFWDIWLKIYRLPNFNMLFQLELTKFFKSELFSLITDQLMQKAYPLTNLDTSQNAITLNSPQLSIPWWPLISALGFAINCCQRWFSFFNAHKRFLKTCRGKQENRKPF